MNKILKKRKPADNVVELTLEAKDVVRNAQAGQFIILRVDEEGERCPLPFVITTNKTALLRF